MAAGFRDHLSLAGVWFPAVPHVSTGGFRSVLEMCGVWITSADTSAPPIETPIASDWIVKARRRARR